MWDKTIGIYHGQEYEASEKEDGTITLISDDKTDEKHGFFLYKGKRYIKRIKRNELDALFRRRFKAIYKGYQCFILQEEGDKLLIEIDNIIMDEFNKLRMDRATSHASAAKWIPKSEAEIQVTETPIDIDNY